MYYKDYPYDYHSLTAYDGDDHYDTQLTRRKKITLTSEDAHTSQNLGGGFTRRIFYRTIGPNTFYRYTYNAGNEKLISGGWWIQNNQSFPAYATSSYSNSPNEWVIVLYNPTNRRREAAFTFITKK